MAELTDQLLTAQAEVHRIEREIAQGPCREGRSMSDLVERLRDGYAGNRPFPFTRVDGLGAVAPVYAIREHELKDLFSELTRLTEQNDKLRSIICRSAAAIGNGAAVSPECSIEFMAQLPAEIAAHATRLTGRVKELEHIAEFAEDQMGQAITRAETAERERDEARAALEDIHDMTSDTRLVNRLLEIEKVAARAITEGK